MHNARLQLPDGQRYACVQCGDSCTLFNEVAVFPADRERIEALPWRDVLRPGVEVEKPWAESLVGDGRVKLATCDIGCVFLGTDHLCGLHARHGLASKPQACIDFPYRFTPTPRGTYVGVSFACTAVLGNEGPLVADQGDDLAALITRSTHKEAAPETIRLSETVAISWDAYEMLEECLVALTDDARRTWERRHLDRQAFFDIVVAGLRAAPDRAEQVIASAARTLLQPTESPRLWRMTEKARMSRTLQRAILGLMTALRRTIDETRGAQTSRPLGMTTMLRHYLSPALGWGGVQLPGFHQALRFGDLHRIAWSPHRHPEIDELLRRYERHRLFRKDLVLTGNLWMSVRMMTAQAGLVRWYAIASAARAHRSEVNLDDVRLAIRAVERYFALHSKFDRFVAETPALDLFLGWALRRPRAILSMVGH